ncbi:MAG: 2,3,4,5-tetrahydropyridine-2,6-dicarboxylate N-succinyltransferase, partial [Gammaproteobacteria bacterium]
MNDTAIHSLGLGLATRNAKNEIIEVYYPAPLMNPDIALSSLLLANCAIKSGENAVSEIDETSARALAAKLLEAKFTGHAEQVQQINEGQGQLILCVLFTDSPPKSVAEAYLKLHLLSH